MPTTLEQLAALVGGQISGSPKTKIKKVASIEEADKDSLVFVWDKKFSAEAEASSAGAIVAYKKIPVKNKPAIFVDNPRLAMAKILCFFYPDKKQPAGIHKTAVIAKLAKISKSAHIASFVSVGENSTIGKNTQILAGAVIGNNVKIGDDCKIYPNAVIYDNVSIGNNVHIHSGTAIGVDGYGFAASGQDFIKIPQVGTVIIEDDVEIYSNTTIARGTLGPTIIGKGTKIDCLAHIAHNCVIGKNCAITAQVVLAGSVTFKDHVSVGGQAGFRDHVTVGENAIVIGQSGVTKDVPPNSVVSGFPARDHREEMRFQAELLRLTKKDKL